MGYLGILIVIAGLLAVVTLFVSRQSTRAPQHELEGWKSAYTVCSFLLACALMAVLLTLFAKFGGNEMLPELNDMNSMTLPQQ